MARRPSFRDLRILVIGCSSQDSRHLQKQFANLGIAGSFSEQFPESPQAFEAIDLLIFDGDSPHLFHPTQRLPWPDLPRIALTAVETPSRLKWICEQEVIGHLRKPVRHDGLLTTLTLAYAYHQRLAALQRKVEQQNERLQARRFLFAAQLRLMRELNLDETEAYQRLRSEAMHQQKTLEQLSIELEGRPESWIRLFRQD